MSKVIATIGHWQPITSVPRNGKTFLVLIDFEDGFAPQIVIAKWRRDMRGFCFKSADEDGGWHESGAKFWMPLPEMPKGIKRKGRAV